MMTPIHVQEIDGKPLRFFASPLYVAHRQPDHPWHSADDLRSILRLPPEIAALFQRRMKAEWANVVRTVATPDGLTMIAPHYMGAGMLKFMQYRRKILPTKDRHKIHGKYAFGNVQAMMKMTAGMTDMDRLLFAMGAFKNN